MTPKQPLDPNNLLIIFTRNPEPGKCKTRLAATVGDKAALEIYTFLLAHTARITRELKVHKMVCYSDDIWINDIWDNHRYAKKLQQGKDLGERMENAFRQGFADGFNRIVVIGSDLYDLSATDLEAAFRSLEEHDYVIGPASDGGYYLLGMHTLNEEVFKNKTWGGETVLKETLADISDKRICLLDTRNDVDVYEDIKDLKAFRPFLKLLEK